MRLLIVEDEVSLAKALTVIFRKNGYSLDVVYDGETALEFLETGLYDGVILDVMLPKIDGFTVLRRIREKRNPIPVLMLTAKADIASKVFGLDSGANDYLTKPFAMEELLARVRAMTRHMANGSDSVLRLGNLTLDRATKELSSGTGSFLLTNKEFQMMEFMMSSPKQFISTEQFMEKIWGYDSKAEINVVWVYLSYLRKKLDKLQANVRIRARRNMGYALEVMND